MIQINKSILIEWINMYNSKEAIMPIICGESQQHLEFDDTLILRVEDLDKKWGLMLSVDRISAILRINI